MNSGTPIAGAQEMEGDREGMAILLSDMWHSVVIDFGCVSSRILWINFKFSEVKVFALVWYGPMKERMKKGRGSGMVLIVLYIE